MSAVFHPATRKHTRLLVGLAGVSGSGKTMSALRLAVGLGGRIAFIDTEGGRGLHYAPAPGAEPDNRSSFAFDYAALEAPFTPERYLELVEAAAAFVGPGGTVIVDSASHLWEGPGGLLETASTIAEDMAAKARQKGRQNATADQFTFPSWREPKQRLQRFINRLLQLPTNVILCYRAKEKSKLVKGQIVPLGIQPILDENTPYEMTFLATLATEEPGVPRWTSKALMEGLRPLFRDGEPIGEALGRRLIAWAGGGDDAPATAGEPEKPTRERWIVRFADGRERNQCPTAREWLTLYGQAKEQSDDKLAVAVANLPTLRRVAAEAKNGLKARLDAEIEAAEAMAGEPTDDAQPDLIDDGEERR